MKKIAVFTFASLFLCPLLSMAAAPVDYSGTWVLDKARSKDLPPQYAQVSSHRLLNKQDAQSLRVQVDIETAAGALEPQLFDYRLDGAVTETKTEVRTPAGKQMVPTSMSTKLDEAGQLHITITRRLPSHGGSVTLASTEDWQLSTDGKTLTVRLTRQGSSSDLLFVRA
jgi:hypothetical protein